MKSILCWHFTDGMKLRDGQKLVAGRTYRHRGTVVPCKSGLHASVRLIDALRYAPGPHLSRVEMRGEVIEHGDPVDKIVGCERKVLWHMDATRVLLLFACWVVEDTLKAERKAGREPHPDSWAAPKARRAWLAGRITDAQLSAAKSAAESAAESAARSAAYSAARSAAYSAARSAAYSAAHLAAYSAAYSAASKRQNRKLTSMILQARAKGIE